MDAIGWLRQPLENPWPMAIGLMFVGLGVGQVLASRGDRRGAWVTRLSAVLLAVGLIAAARAITTPREALLGLTRDLVHAVGGDAGEAMSGGVDTATIEAIVAEDAWIVGPDGSAWIAFDRALPRLPGLVERFGVTGQAIRSLDAEADDAGGTSFVRVSTQTQGGLPATQTAWVLRWRRQAADERWRVVELAFVQWMNQSPTRDMLP
jgi:hypothetical protein